MTLARARALLLTPVPDGKILTGHYFAARAYILQGKVPLGHLLEKLRFSTVMNVVQI